MRLQELFSPSDLIVGLEARDKWDAIERMLGHLERTGRIRSEAAPAVLEAVLARERSMSTGMERGIAIPHAAVDGVAEVAAALAVVGGDGLNFESIDASPTQLVVLLVIPKSQKLVHIRTLADVARVLGRESVRARLAEAADADAAWAALDEGAP